MTLHQLSPLVGVLVLSIQGCTPPGPSLAEPSPQDTALPIEHTSAGHLTVAVPVPDDEAETVALRLRWPASDRSRYTTTAPVVIHVDGGWNAGRLSDDATAPLAEQHGYIHVSFLLPGGRASDGASKAQGI